MIRSGFLLAILFICIDTFQSFAQPPSFTLKGVIVDNDSGSPLEFATVSLKRVRDSSLASGIISDPTGNFMLADIPPGAYQVEIAFIGFERFVRNYSFIPGETPAVTDLGTIRLKSSALILQEAEITAEKSFVMNNIDRKTYNTDQLSVTTGGNVTDVLENIPSVEVDADGGISLRGNENVTILIDGRPSGMTGAGGKSLLESIPSSAIEKVEVITNPSAKYDPDGISGIINIITKKNKLQGFTGTVGSTINSEGRITANTSLNYRKRKWNVTTTYGFEKGERKNSGKSYRETYFNDVTEILKQEDTGLSDRINHNIKIGVDYSLSQRTTISMSALANFQDSENKDDILYRFFDGNLVADRIYRRNTAGVEDELNYDFDFAVMHKFPQEGRQLNIQATGSIAENTEDQQYLQLGYITDDIPYPVFPDLQKDFTGENNDIYTVAADYEHPVGKDKKIETGYKSTFRSFDTDYRYEFLNNSTGNYENDVNRTNHFKYTDELHAVYAQYRQSIKKFGFQAGVRSEYAKTNSTLITTGDKFDKDYFSIFPSLFVTYTPDENSQFKATYSRRINRPRRQSLNPFADYEDPLNIRRGNPFLDPEYSDSYELEYSRFIGKISLTATGYMRLTSDYIQRYRQILPEGITVTTFENLAESRNYGLELILNGSPYKWWNFTLSSNIFRNELNASNLQQDLTSSSVSVSGRLVSTFRMSYGIELQVSYFYRAPMQLTQGKMKEMQNLNIAASKKVLKDKGLISIRISDPFNVQRFGFEFRDPNYYQEITRKRRSRVITAGFTYRFGELRDRDAKRKRDQSAPSDDMDFGE